MSSTAPACACPTRTVFALLGPNSAGKTTTVQILSTLITPDSGRAQIAGHDLTTAPGGVRATIGVTGQCSADRGQAPGAAA
ncbi:MULTISPECIES: ATP-binding cassette domain-containing protein [unclassified Streptomyces]|uniref:ATP-binding cassette domain-containing protein n=1 Tax=unclassified Streptomyces TaxID=2593676 RepID=UPI0037B76E96